MRYIPVRSWFVLVLDEMRVIGSAVAWTSDGRGGSTVNFVERHGDMSVK